MFQVNDERKSSIEITNASGTFLHHISEDCLLEIFSVKTLSLMDLCSLAETCTRFQQTTKRIFPKELNISILEIKSEEFFYVTSGIDRRSMKKYKACDIERILKIFGSTSRAISIENFPHCGIEKATNFVLNLVTENCADNLNSLKINCMKIDNILTVKLRPIFKRLQKLQLDHIPISVDNELFADLDSLIELHVSQRLFTSNIMKIIFPKLERFTSVWPDFGFAPIMEHQPFSTFISRHTGLKALTLQISLVESGRANLMQEIGKSCKELVKLSLRIGKLDSTCLLQMESLKNLECLELYHASCEDFTFIAGMIKLRELKLFNCSLPEVHKMDILNRLTTLEISPKRCTRCFIDVIGIIVRLQNLEKFNYCSEIDEETFDEIIKIAKGRPKVLTLGCYFNFDVDPKLRTNVELVSLMI